MPPLGRQVKGDCSRQRLFAALKDEGSLAGLHIQHNRFRGRLITVQVAVCCLFLVATGLLVRGLLNLNRADPGFRVEHVVLTSIDRQNRGADVRRNAAFYRDLLARLDAGSGTEGALATVVPFRGVSVTGTAPADAETSRALSETHFNSVSSNYFRVLGIPLLHGRTFTDAEMMGNNTQVAVISDAMRRAYWGAGSALGQLFRYGTEGRTQIAEVVGVASDVRASHISAVDGPTFYLPFDRATSQQSSRRRRILKRRSQSCNEWCASVIRRRSCRSARWKTTFGTISGRRALVRWRRSRWRRWPCCSRPSASTA